MKIKENCDAIILGGKAHNGRQVKVVKPLGAIRTEEGDLIYSAWLVTARWAVKQLGKAYVVPEENLVRLDGFIPDAEDRAVRAFYKGLLK